MLITISLLGKLFLHFRHPSYSPICSCLTNIASTFFIASVLTIIPAVCIICNFLVDGPKETVRIDESILPEDTTFGVRISGDSMEPEFHDGQIAWVLQQESVANGEIGIFALNGEAYIKKLQNDKDGIFLISLNEKYAPIKVSENDRLDIFGKVLGKSDASAITGHCR